MTTGTKAGTLHTRSALLGAQSSPATASQRTGRGVWHILTPASPAPPAQRAAGWRQCRPQPLLTLQQEAFSCRAAAKQTLNLPLQEGAQELLPNHWVPLPACSRGLLLPPPGSVQLLPGQQWEAEAGATFCPARSQLGAATHPEPSPASILQPEDPCGAARHHCSIAQRTSTLPGHHASQQQSCPSPCRPTDPTPLHQAVTPRSLQQGRGATPAPSPPSPSTHWQRHPDLKYLRSQTHTAEARRRQQELEHP